MISKINITPIIKDHLRTLKDARGTRVLKRDILGFFGLPICISLLLIYKDIILPEKYINIGIIAHTIAIPLLVNVLFLIYNIMERNRLNQTESKVLKQLYQNLAYTILISFFSLFLLAAYNVNFFSSYAQVTIRFLFYSVFMNVFLTSLMIIKRCHNLISRELDKP